MPWRDDVTLHLQTVRYLLRENNIGEPPEILSGAAGWLPDEERARLREAVEADLREERQLVGDAIGEDLHDVLVLLTRPAIEYFAWIQSGELGHYAVSVARGGKDCVRLLRKGDWLRIMPANPERPIGTFVDQLPAYPSGVGGAISLPEREAPWSLADPANPPTPAARDLVALLDAERTGGGQLHAATRVSGQPRHRAPNPLTYLDTVDGRWLIAFDDGEPGKRWVTALPGTQHVVEQRVADLLEA